MKNITTKTISKFSLKASMLLIAGLFIFNGSQAQTPVHGGIYSNTTWTLANSPYIVTDTVVVFPGVTLTIQPGVVVKFDANKYMEIRQAQLIAVGLKTDSITFTANSLSPTVGFWSKISLNGGSMVSRFNYCVFSYADSGIRSTATDSLIVRNSYFRNNNWGETSLAGVAVIDSSNYINNLFFGACFNNMAFLNINHSNFSHNGAGDGPYGGGLYSTGFPGIVANSVFEYDTMGMEVEMMKISNCHISNNRTGIYSSSENTIKNSYIDSNTLRGILVSGDSVYNNQINYNGYGVSGGISVILNNTIEHNTFSGFQDAGSWGGSRIIGDTIEHNPRGIDSLYEASIVEGNWIKNNTIGIKLANSGSSLSCNSICNNSSYGLYYCEAPNISIAHNYWGTADSIHTQPLIYDGYNNISYGLAFFTPIDLFGCCINKFVQDICIVSTDTAVDKNIIIWGRNNSPPQTPGGYFNVYRKDPANNWIKIASVPDTSLSQYIDTGSHPNLQAYSYRISTVDSCGESALSPFNTTIFLQVAQLVGKDSLYWTPYVGFGTPKYYIYRGLALNALTLIDSVSGATLDYVDNAPPLGSLYLVEAVNPGGPCVPTHRDQQAGNKNVSMSNGGVPYNPLGIAGIQDLKNVIRIAPNPNNGKFSVQMNSQRLIVNSQIEVYNMIGEKIYTTKLNSGTTQINLSGNNSGIYLYRVNTETGSLISEGKFIIE